MTAWPRKRLEAGAVYRLLQRDWPLAVVILVLILLAVTWISLLRSRGGVTPPAKTVAVGPGADPPHATAGGEAPVTLEEFADLQCPPCAALQPQLKQVAAGYGPRVRLVFRHFPLAGIHQHAVAAALAAEAAGLQGRFWEMHDLIYEHQGEWAEAADPRAIFLGYAERLRLDAARFARDFDGQDLGGQLVKARVLLDQHRGESLGVEGTPTLFLNGRELSPEAMTAAGLREAVEAALKGPRP